MSSGPSCGRRGRVGDKGGGGVPGPTMVTLPDAKELDLLESPVRGENTGGGLLPVEELLLRGMAWGWGGIVSDLMLEPAARSYRNRIRVDVGANTGCCGKATSFLPICWGARDG
jgi:hypothetical protein